MSSEPWIDVTVAYALPERYWLLPVRVPGGATVAEGIDASGIGRLVPEIDLSGSRVGIFGKLCTLQTPLRDGDRIELYRPLQCDPKAVRRQRAEAERTTDKAG